MALTSEALYLQPPAICLTSLGRCALIVLVTMPNQCVPCTNDACGYRRGESTFALLTTWHMSTCPGVIGCGESTRSGGLLYYGGVTSKVIIGKVWSHSFGTSVPTVGTPDWFRPVGF